MSEFLRPVVDKVLNAYLSESIDRYTPGVLVQYYSARSESCSVKSGSADQIVREYTPAPAVTAFSDLLAGLFNQQGGIVAVFFYLRYCMYYVVDVQSCNVCMNVLLLLEKSIKEM